MRNRFRLKVLVSVTAILGFAGCSSGGGDAKNADGETETTKSAQPEKSASSSASAPSTASASASAAPSSTASAAPVKSEPAPLVLDLNATGEPPTNVPAALYGKLFKKDTKWKVSGTRKHQGLNDQGKPVNTTEKFSTDCKVDSVTKFSWGLRSDISCKALPSAGSVALLPGSWFATTSGLYHTSDAGTGKVVELRPEEQLFSSTITPSKTESQESEGEGGSVRSITQNKDVWCFDWSATMGDEGWSGICMSEKAGFVSGKYGWAGGSSDEVEFTAK